MSASRCGLLPSSTMTNWATKRWKKKPTAFTDSIWRIASCSTLMMICFSATTKAATDRPFSCWPLVRYQRFDSFSILFLYIFIYWEDQCDIGYFTRLTWFCPSFPIKPLMTKIFLLYLLYFHYSSWRNRFSFYISSRLVSRSNETLFAKSNYYISIRSSCNSEILFAKKWYNEILLRTHIAIRSCLYKLCRYGCVCNIESNVIKYFNRGGNIAPEIFRCIRSPSNSDIWTYITNNVHLKTCKKCKVMT